MRIVPPLNGHPWREIWMTRGLGSSNASTILGLNRFETPQSLWEYLTHRREKPEPTPAMLRGREQEQMIRDFYTRRFDVEGCPLNIIDSEVDFIRAQIDFMDVNGDRAAEFKSTTSRAIIDSMRRKEVPHFYIPQLTHQCMLLGRTEMDLFVYDGNEYYYAVFTVDPVQCVNLRRREIAWWNRYVVPDRAPSDNTLELARG